MDETIPELKSFISAALVEIVAGVDSAEAPLSTFGAVINPDVKGKAEDLAAAGIVTAMDPLRAVKKGEKPRKVVVRVRFDIGIAAEKTKEGGVKLGIVGALLGTDAKATLGRKGSSEHRISFEVPILLRSYEKDA